MQITSIRTSGLGDTTYVCVHEGVAAVVDPQRDFERFAGAVDDASLRFVFETHVHNDYVSGAVALADRYDAEVVMPAASGAAYRHRPAFHLEDLDAGPFQIRPIHTPGHTPEHTSYLLLVEDQPVAVFSGGSLLVGSAGRPDLLGMQRADSLARLQYGSVQRLAALPDDVELYPTHGEGSFCTVTTSGATASTIGVERRTNPMLQYDDEDSFAKAQLTALQPFPDYYAYMGPINLMGPEAAPSVTLPELTPQSIPSAAGIVDVRPRDDYAAGHLAGSLGIPLTDTSAVWAGWLLPFDTPIVVVANRDQPIDDVVVQFARIGFDQMVGVVYDVAGAELVSYEQRSDDDLVALLDAGETPQIIDVRAPNEFETTRVGGSVNGYVPHLREGLPRGIDPNEDVWVMCASGNRATIAAALVERHGAQPIVVARGGVTTVLEKLGAGATE